MENYLSKKLNFRIINRTYCDLSFYLKGIYLTYNSLQEGQFVQIFENRLLTEEQIKKGNLKYLSINDINLQNYYTLHLKILFNNKEYYCEIKYLGGRKLWRNVIINDEFVPIIQVNQNNLEVTIKILSLQEKENKIINNLKSHPKFDQLINCPSILNLIQNELSIINPIKSNISASEFNHEQKIYNDENFIPFNLTKTNKRIREEDNVTPIEMKKKYCNNCKIHRQNKNKLCNQCGNLLDIQIIKTKFCINCKSYRKNVDKLCHQCGTLLIINN